MKLYSLLLLFAFITSCTGQVKSELSKESAVSNPVPTENSIPENDFDPYFTESKDNSSIHGPNSITRNVMQDKSGKIWLATWLGIIGYDGKTFTNYTNKEGLRRHRVFSLLEDRKGTLWFGTIGAGVYKYDKSADQTDGNGFINITTNEGLVNNDIGCIYEDSKGNIWFGTRVGISRYDGKSFQNFTTENGLSNNDVNSIIEDKNGRLWIGTRGEACYYENNEFTTFAKSLGPVFEGDGSTFENVRCIIEDRNGNIWLGGNDGLWRSDGEIPPGEQASFMNLSKSFVGYIYEDQKGNIWTSSEAADQSHNWVLSRYDRKTGIQNKKATATEIITKKDMFFGITEDDQGNIWFGSLNGVCRYDGSAFKCFKEESTKK